MRLVTATILSLALAGCAETSAELQARRQMSEAKALEARYDEELAAPSFAILAGKIDLRQVYRPDTDPCAAIQEDRVPTAEESAALRQRSDLRTSYMAHLEALIMTEPSGTSQVKGLVDRFDATMDDGLRAQAVLISSLAEGRLTYCQFARLDRDLTEDVLKRATALRGDILKARATDYGLSHRLVYGDGTRF